MSTNDFPSLERNPFEGQPHAWIQWKGTDVCMDVDCSCGAKFHIDAAFAYYVKCMGCNTVYEVGGHVKLYPMEYEPTTNVKIDEEQLPDSYYRELCVELDDRDGLSSWEVYFLYRLFNDHNKPLTPLEKEVIDKMKEKYLD